jgi:hypothetical protein
MSMGKHVYVEKPLTHSYREADLLIRAEKKFGVVTQMGNQGHTSGAPPAGGRAGSSASTGRTRPSAASSSAGSPGSAPAD